MRCRRGIYEQNQGNRGESVGDGRVRLCVAQQVPEGVTLGLNLRL